MVAVASKVQWTDFNWKEWSDLLSLRVLDDYLQPYLLSHLYEQAPAFEKKIFVEAFSILKTLSYDKELLAAAAFSWLSKQTLTGLENFIHPGSHAVEIVKQYYHLQTITHKATNSLSFYKESIKKMLLAAVDDPRLILVLLCEVLARLRHHHLLEESYKKTLANLTLELYAPLAHRHGIGQVKWEMEDLAFYILHTENYYALKDEIAEKKEERQQYIQNLLEDIRAELKKEDISAQVMGRAKHFYSIWRKMQKKNKTLSQVYDLNALRILVDTLQDCYKVLGLMHTKWKYLPAEFKDYIANPKINGYQSIHTAVIGPDQKIVELQIRTKAMHEYAEMGIAAHWMYKENSNIPNLYERKWKMLRHFLDQSHASDDYKDDYSGDLFESIKEEIFSDRIYVFTPKGDLFDLPKGATALDFAYYLHSDLGHHCCGARTQGRMISLSEPLENGAVVEILQSSRAHPSRDWLNPQYGYLKTARARQKVSHWFRALDKNRHIQDGKLFFEKSLKKQHMIFTSQCWEKILHSTHCKTKEDFYHGVSLGEIKLQRIFDLFDTAETPVIKQSKKKKMKAEEAESALASQVIFSDLGKNIQYILASCCQPAVHDPILGMINRGRPLSVHSTSCLTLATIAFWSQRFVLARWHGSPKFQAFRLHIRYLDYQDPPSWEMFVCFCLKQNLFAFQLLDSVSPDQNICDLFSQKHRTIDEIRALLGAFLHPVAHFEIHNQESYQEIY